MVFGHLQGQNCAMLFKFLLLLAIVLRVCHLGRRVHFGVMSTCGPHFWSWYLHTQQRAAWDAILVLFFYLLNTPYRLHIQLREHAKTASQRKFPMLLPGAQHSWRRMYIVVTRSLFNCISPRCLAWSDSLAMGSFSQGLNIEIWGVEMP